MDSNNSIPTENQSEDLLKGRYLMADILRIDGMGDRYAKYTFTDTQNNNSMVVGKEMIMPMASREERQDILERFMSQGEKFMKLSHPSLCKIYDCFMEKGCLYLIMEYIIGEYLDEILQNYLLKTKAPFSEKQVIEVSFRICEALEYLHTNEIQCGTLQPNNIMFAREAGRLVLLDFGISRILIPEPEKFPIYSQGFSPPEQYEGIIEPRSDIYSLGAIMHYLLSGIDPKLYNVQFTYPPLRSIKPELSKEIEAIVEKALQKDIVNRFNSAAELKGSLGMAYRGLARTVISKNSWLMYRGNPARTGCQGEAPKNIPRFWWKFKTGKGAISCPVVLGDIVYIAAYDRYVYGINIKDGSTLWEYSVRGELSSSPAIYEGSLYVGCMDCNLYALDINLIKLKWKYKTDGLITSSPAILGETVCIGSYDSFVYGVDINGGKLKWKFNAGGTVMSCPGICNNIIYFGSLDSHLYALNGETGEIIWKFKTGYSISSSPAIDEGRAFIGSYDGNLYCMDSNTGQIIWIFNTKATITSTPVVSNGIVYAGNHNGQLFAVDVHTGKALWQHFTSEAFQNSPALAGDKLYLCAEKTKLFVLDAKTGQSLANIDCGVAFSSSPTVADGMLLIGTYDGYLYAFK